MTEESVGISDGALKIVAGYSALAGLCPLIPIPFLDDMLVARVHRRLCKKLCEQHDFYLSDENAKRLTSKPSKLLSGAIKSLVLWPIKKLIRKVLYVLTVKSCADVAAAVFHEGWLLARALEQEYVPLDDVIRGHKGTIVRLRDGIFEAHGHINPDVTRQVMRSAFGVGREVFQQLLETMRGIFKSEAGEDKIDAAEQEAAPISKRIMEELDAHWSLGSELDLALRKALDVER